MKILKKIFKILCYILGSIAILLLLTTLWHNIANLIYKNKYEAPGDKIEVYKNEFIHSVKLGEGENTIVLLPGMGTASPYYDFYNLAQELSKTYQVIVMEPLGYGFSDNTDKKRGLKEYEFELSKVLDYYNVNQNIILLGHSYSGISNLYYANRHQEVKGVVCLDCTSAYQIETHTKDGKFIEEVPLTSDIYSLVSPLGLTRLFYSTIMANQLDKEIYIDVPKEYINAYKHLSFNKTFNKTIIHEINDIYYNQLEILNEKYREDLQVVFILSSDTVKEMKQYKAEGAFYKDWEEMHNNVISNNENQKIYILEGDHYIHHNNVEETALKIKENIK